VFAGGFEEDAAIEVCSDPRLPAGRITGLLGALVDKSILKRQLRGACPPRYWLLETMRQYGLERLREVGGQIATQQRHFDWIRVLAEAIGAWDDRQVALFDRMRGAHERAGLLLGSAARVRCELADPGRAVPRAARAVGVHSGPWDRPQGL
jgi:predicted ATPase